jgi:hypothetical protein
VENTYLFPSAKKKHDLIKWLKRNIRTTCFSVKLNSMWNILSKTFAEIQDIFPFTKLLLIAYMYYPRHKLKEASSIVARTCLQSYLHQTCSYCKYMKKLADTVTPVLIKRHFLHELKFLIFITNYHFWSTVPTVLLLLLLLLILLTFKFWFRRCMYEK